MNHMGKAFVWLIVFVITALFCAGLVIYRIVFYEMADDQLFSIAAKAFNEDPVGIQCEVDAILINSEGFGSGAHIDDGKTKPDEVWGEPNGFVKGSRFHTFSKRLPNSGCYSLCRINGENCIRIRYGWPRSLADVFLFHSKDEVPVKRGHVRLTRHALINRVIRHD